MLLGIDGKGFLTSEQKHFQENICRYNPAMAFASYASATPAAKPLPGRGPPVYVQHGQVVHAISILIPSAPQKPSFGQMYFYDP